MLPRIAFCTTCKGRTGHLQLTLPRNIDDNKDYPDCVFVVLDYNSHDNMQDYLTFNHKSDIKSDRLVVYGMPPGPDGPIPFRMGHAKNMAHRCGILEHADILVNMDADAYSGPGFAAYLAEQFSNKDARIFMQAMWNRWVDSDDGGREWLAMDPSGELGPPIPKGANGRMAVTVNAFRLAGGYNEKYDTWGADDKDFNIRIRRLGYEPLLLERRFHETVLHNDKVRFKEYPHAASRKNSGEFMIKVEDSDEMIANFGRIGMGTVYRNFDVTTPIELGPLPTRIFGCGLHKTATTSLHTALGMLGYDSAHWSTAHWAKAVWSEMTTMGRSPTLERHYAACDLPIAILYRQLDAAYPGSRFILTVRDESAWIASVRRHWDANANPHRRQWDHDPFSHFIHKEIYGRRDFDAETMLARYRRHNSDVKEYFASRSDDLLVLGGGNQWESLCRFLGNPVPAAPYPKMNGNGNA